MPQYSYQCPKTKKVKDVFQSMNEEHVYEENGVKWERLWTVPQASFDTNVDPFSQKQFVEKTGKGNGKVGDVWERSAELSAKRADKNGGSDPVKEDYYKKYSSSRKGKCHPRQIKEQTDKINIVI